MPVMILRSIAMTKEEAAVFRTALAVLKEPRNDLLTDEGKVVLKTLTEKADDLLDRFPKEA